MKIISLVSWKGGTGKTTVACNLAERAARAGLRVLLCDFDPQESAQQHCLRRERYPGDLPRIEVARADMSVSGIAGLERAIQRDNHDLIICDTPGSDDMAWDRCADLANLLLVPLAPSPYEVVVTRRFLEHGLERGWKQVVVLNNLSSGKRRIDDLRGMLNMMEVPVAPVNLIRRVDYWDSGMQGLGVCELSPRGAACREMQMLWDWLVGELEIELPEQDPDENHQEVLL